jgi:hypothetical protein
MKMTARALKEHLQNTSSKKHDLQKALNRDHPNKQKVMLSLEMKRIATTAVCPTIAKRTDHDLREYGRLVWRARNRDLTAICRSDTPPSAGAMS